MYFCVNIPNYSCKFAACFTKTLVNFMNVKSIFLDPTSLEETGGYYGLVATLTNPVVGQNRFTDQYISKVLLVEELQERLNYVAQDMMEMPSDADRSGTTEVWKAMNGLLHEIKNL